MPQYVDTIFEENDFGNEDNGLIYLLFPDNVGKAQPVNAIIRAVALLKNDPWFKFNIVGSDSELDNIKKLATELKTTITIHYPSTTGCSRKWS